MKHVIGLTGTIGSGHSFISKTFIEPLGYRAIKLSDILREVYKEENRDSTPSTKDLQDLGNRLRSEHGTGYLSGLAIDRIDKSDHSKWIVDSIRNPGEISALRQRYSGFYLVGVYADPGIRWSRMKDKYRGRKDLFDADEERDQKEEADSGQRALACLLDSDLIISNDKPIHTGSEGYREKKETIERYIDLMLNPYSERPFEKETFMTMAYAHGHRSSCLQRKVGAVLVDEFGQVFSTGNNEVPLSSKSCMDEFGGCYRKKLQREISTELQSACSSEPNVFDKLWKRVKSLENCRSLHAEERAILNVARTGSNALPTATLYTTTFPCNMCANKIVEVGLKKVVYFEPYPQKESRDIMSNQGIVQEAFEGITSRAYFRVYGGVLD